MTRYALIALGLMQVASLGCSKAGADEPITVSASHVRLETSGNNLGADGGTVDLQTAIDDTIRVSLSTLLPGTTWTVENKTSDDTYSGTGKTGKVAFSATGTTLQVVSGALAVAGQVHDDGRDTHDAYCNPLSDLTYEIVSDKVLYVTSATQGSAVIQVADATKDRLILTGAFGCGATGIGRISVLTLVP